ncbi:MAG: hypothetical protein LWW91_02945, partial [Bacteroidales bacterium]|nr:hypothetical protein [Bacteroidales bacterium]
MRINFKKAVAPVMAIAMSWSAAAGNEPVLGKDMYRLSDTTVIRLAGVEVNAGRNRVFSRAGRVVEEVKADELR